MAAPFTAIEARKNAKGVMKVNNVWVTISSHAGHNFKKERCGYLDELVAVATSLWSAAARRRFVSFS